MQNHHISIQTKLCKACWKCVLNCPNKVLGRISLPFHKHVKIANSDNCIGCFKCEKECEYGAIARNG